MTGWWSRIPWRTLWRIAQWLATSGRDRLEKNLPKAEQQRFWELVKKSKGRPWKNLTKKEQEELRHLIRKAITGEGGNHRHGRR